MVIRGAISVGLSVLVLGPLHGQGKDAAPGNPPVVLLAAGIDPDGDLVLVQYKTIFIQPTEKGGGGPLYNERSLRKVALKGVKIYGGIGKEVPVEAARTLLRDKETAVLASSWGQSLPPVYQKVFRDDALLFAFPREAPMWKTIEAPDVPVKK
jgi:hypothetical protein